MDAFEIHTITTKVSCYSKVFMKGVYVLHFFPRLLGIVVFSTYDTQCSMRENASIFDCTQESLVGSPKDWILCWLVSSILSSVAFYFICCWYGPKRYVWHLSKSVSFWILMMLFLITFASFSIRIINTELKDMALFLALFLWWPSTIARIIYLNNQPPAQNPYNRPQCRECNRLQQTGSAEITGRPCNHQNQGNTLWFYYVYYTSLFIQFLECCAMAGAITLDVIGISIPAVIHGDVHGVLFMYIIKFFVAMRVFCIYGIALVYLQKVFQGNTTLFSEPGEALESHQHEQHAV